MLEWSIVVRQVSGGISALGFKSFEAAGRDARSRLVRRGPHIDIYWEGLTRTNFTNGLVFLTLTPLTGMSEVLMQFANCAGFK